MEYTDISRLDSHSLITAGMEMALTAKQLLDQYTARLDDDIEQKQGWFSWIPAWKPTSLKHLTQAETEVLSNLQTPYTDLYVPIGKDTFIRTITMAPDTPSSDIPRHPLVMVHGFGCGLGAFYKNYDYLHSKRRLFAFDVLGFGRSSRTSFSTEPKKIEDEFVESFEKWRNTLGLEKMILLAHSLGAYISCAYAMKYPERVQHLLLIEPWGFVSKPEVDLSPITQYKRFKLVSAFAGSINIFSPLRAAGPLGPCLISSFRPDIKIQFGEHFMAYIYHCNAQNPTGETAFFYLKTPIAWAKRPMLERLDVLDRKIPITIMYGTRTWFDNSTGEKIYAMRPDSYVDVHYFKDASHHIHADTPSLFNDIVNTVCDLADRERERLKRKDPETAFHSHFLSEVAGSHLLQL